MQRIQFDFGRPDTEALLARGDGELKYRGIPRKERETNTEIVHGPVPYIKYKIYAPYEDDLVHAFTTRFGGVSTGHLKSLNLSFSRGDDADNVRENYRRLGEALGIDVSRAVFSDQVHLKTIRRVTAADAGKGLTKESDIRETDGLMTDEPGLPIFTFYADCVPVYFYDPIHKAIGLAHSGWKGTVADIAGEMVRAMGKAFGTDAEALICAIGPSICMDCYEVSEDVAFQFIEKYGDRGTDWGDRGTVLLVPPAGGTKEPSPCLPNPPILLDKGGGKYQLNLHEAVRQNLLAAGVTKQNIAMPDLCTCCNPEFLFSHRASKGMRGNLAAVMMLK